MQLLRKQLNHILRRNCGHIATSILARRPYPMPVGRAMDVATIRPRMGHTDPRMRKVGITIAIQEMLFDAALNCAEGTKL